MQSKVAKSSGNVGNEWTGVLLTLVSASLFLWVIGVLILFWMHDDNIVNFFKENTNIVAELKAKASPEEVKQVGNILKQHAFIRPGTVHFVDKFAALNMMKSDLGEDLLTGDEENPFRDIYRFNVKAKHSTKEDIALLLRELKRQEAIEEVYAQTEYLSYWDIWKHRINKLLTIVGAILSVLAVGLIFNMLRLMIEGKAYSIHLMKLVGASWSFIRMPFYRKSVKYAVASASIASFLLGLCVVGILIYIPGIGEYFNMSYVIVTMIILLIFSLILFISGTFVVLRKFLGH